MPRRPGFTILELLIALLVISVLAALAIPAYLGRPEVTLEKAAVLLARDLLAARSRAAYFSEPCRFEFPRDGDGYRVLDLEGYVIENPTTNQPFVREYSYDAVFRGVSVIDVRAGGDRALEFDHRGHASETVEITLGYRDDMRVVVIDEGIGRVSIRGSTSGWTDSDF